MYDNTCKFLAATFSQDMAQWLIGEPIELIELKPTELSLEPIRADSIIFLQSDDLVLHIEFQTDPKDDIPFRMLDYRLRVYRLYPHKRMYQVVIYLRQSGSALAQKSSFEIPGTRHEYNIIRLWEMPTEPLLQAPGLYPFAVLSQTKNPVDVLSNVAKKIHQITNPREQSNLAASTAILAGLVLNERIVKQLLKEEIMKESVIYQEIQATSEAKGRIEGIQEGEANLVMRQLNRRLGTITANLEQQIRQLNTEQLEELGIALLDFQSAADLVNWLNS